MKTKKMQIFTLFSIITILSFSSITNASSKTAIESLADSQSMASLASQPVSEDGIIQLRVHKNKKEINVNVIMDQKKINKNSLEKYKKEMPKLFNKLKKDDYKELPSTITLNNALSFEEFHALLENYDFEVNRIFVQTQTVDGTLGALTVPVEDNKISLEKVNSLISGPLKIQINGVYAFETSLSTRNTDFENLITNKKVYLVDISRLEIENNVKKSKAFKDVLKKDDNIYLDVNVFDFYWELKNSH